MSTSPKRTEDATSDVEMDHIEVDDNSISTHEMDAPKTTTVKDEEVVEIDLGNDDHDDASSSAASAGSSSHANRKQQQQQQQQADAQPTFYQKYIEKRLNKGFLSNTLTFVIMIIGLILRLSLPQDVVAPYILAFGLFGFSGGFTNWLAVKMLFDKVPGLVGSGVIPTRFKEIRETVKNTIMKTFFDPEFLKKYVKQKTGQFTASLNIEEKIGQMLESEAVDNIIDVKLKELAERPEGMMIAMMGVNPASLKPMIKPFVLGMGSDIAPLLLETFDPSKNLNVDKLREEIDSLMTTKLEELTPEIVKELLEEVIRVHLGWLIVWGNVFGGAIGLVSQAVGYGG